jgi:hypothetical protein
MVMRIMLESEALGTEERSAAEHSPPNAFDDVEKRSAACDLYGCFMIEPPVCCDIDLLAHVSLRYHLMHIKRASECVRVNF